MTETKHRRPARRTLAHGQPLRRPMARRTPQRRPTAGQRPRPAVGRLWQLVVCGALLLGVVAIKLTAPDTLEPYRQRLLMLMGGDTDFTAAFSAVGHAFDGSLTGALDDAYTAVFGPRQAQPTAATYTAENTPEDVCLTQQVLGFAYAAPVQGTVTDGFGWRENAFHYGTDIAADAGTVISSFADGTVTAVGDSSQLGNYVTVSHAGAFTTLYAHCSRITASSGQQVALGDPIAEGWGDRQRHWPAPPLRTPEGHRLSGSRLLWHWLSACGSRRGCRCCWRPSCGWPPPLLLGGYPVGGGVP